MDSFVMLGVPVELLLNYTWNMVKSYASAVIDL